MSIWSNSKNQNIKHTTYWLCTTAIFMALNIAMSSFGVPVPGGHLYMNDIIICTAAIILDPFAAFMAGGVGAFLGDLFFSAAYVCLSCNAWLASGGYICVFALHPQKAPCIVFRNRCDAWCYHYGSRIFSRQSVHLQCT